MRVSTRGRYGVNAVFELALRYGEEPMSLKTIAERQCIPLPYLEQLIIKLRKSGIVKSVRGAKGGYSLLISPDELTIHDVLTILEGDLAPVHCKDVDDDGCEHKKDCAGHYVWSKVHESVKHIMETYTFRKLIEDYNNGV